MSCKQRLVPSCKLSSSMPSYHQHVPAVYQYYSCICACVYIYMHIYSYLYIYCMYNSIHFTPMTYLVIASTTSSTHLVSSIDSFRVGDVLCVVVRFAGLAWHFDFAKRSNRCQRMVHNCYTAILGTKILTQRNWTFERIGF